MSKICGSCTYLDLNTGNCYGKYYCNKKWDRHLATDTACSSYTKAYSRSNSSINNAVDFSNAKTSSNCYITTLLCELLSLSDSNYYINILRKFRNDFLRYNMEYYNILVEYDIVGPEICKYLVTDKQNRLIAAKMFYNYIEPIVSLIKDNMYVDAIERYKLMVDKFKSLYGIDTNITEKQIDDCNILLSGHGKYVKSFNF